MIAFERFGTPGAPPVVCLHGWPGDWSDYRELVPLLAESCDVVVPHLAGFGASFTPGDEGRPPSDFGRDAQVAAVAELLGALNLGPAVVVGYDVGSTVAQALVRAHPERVLALVLGNVLAPSTFEAAVLAPERRGEFWYQDFHQLAVCSALIDGTGSAVRAYLGAIWDRWGGRPIGREVTDELVAGYARPGAFTTSLNWYRSGSASVRIAEGLRASGELPGPIDVAANVVWGAQDPLFPPDFAGAVRELLPRAEVRVFPDVGHFVPLEAAAETADAVLAFL